MGDSNGTLKITMQGGVYHISGVLDENASLAGLDHAKPPLKLNLENLQRCNSIGIRTLLRFISTWGDKPFEYLDCPVEFIYQLNMIPSLLGVPKKVGRVVSFTIPYECNDCEYEEEIKVQSSDLGNEEPNGKWGQRTCPKCQGVMDIADFSYFGFLKS